MGELVELPVPDNQLPVGEDALLESWSSTEPHLHTFDGEEEPEAEELSEPSAS